MAQGRCGTRNKYTGEKQQEEYAGRGNSLCKIPEAKWSVREDSLEKKAPSQSLKRGPGERAFQPEGSKWAKAQVCKTPRVCYVCPCVKTTGVGVEWGEDRKAMQLRVGKPVAKVAWQEVAEVSVERDRHGSLWLARERPEVRTRVRCWQWCPDQAQSWLLGRPDPPAAML